MSRRAALLLLTCLAAPATAETTALPCKPPVGARFTAIHEQHGWTRAGVPSRVTLSRTLRFEAAPSGTTAVLGPARATSDLTGPEAQRLALLYAPGGEQEARMQIDAQGRIVAVEDLDRHWRDYLARLETLAQQVEAGGGAAARTRTALAALAKADDPAQMAAIDGEIEPFLHLCGQTVDGSATPDGTVLVTEGDTNADVTAQLRYHIAPETGLVMLTERRLTPAAQPDRPLVQLWRLEPVAP